VEEGKLITTAGGTAGMDMNLGLMARLTGEKNARLLQLMAEYDPQPPFGGIDWSHVKRNGQASFRLEELQVFKQSLAAELSGMPAGRPDAISILRAWADGFVQEEGISVRGERQAAT
jgi:hypothetical protein